jgi:hypothetical protein
MNAIICEPLSARLPSSAVTSTLAPNADEIVGWNSEAQRLALGANRRARTTAMSADCLTEISTDAPPSHLHTTGK